MSLPVSAVDKLLDALIKLLQASSFKAMAGTKAAFTRKLNQYGRKYGVEDTRIAAMQLVKAQLESLPESNQLTLLVKRLTPDTLYKDMGNYFGWYDPSIQVQAELLPLETMGISMLRVNFWRFNKDFDLWQSRGFAEAQDLPFTRWHKELVVDFPPWYADFWKQWGFARAEDLPYERTKEALIVKNNLREYGFWRSYTYWEGCQEWYRDKHPEWFYLDIEVECRA